MNHEIPKVLPSITNEEDIPLSIREKVKENVIDTIRKKKNELLIDTDKYFLPDFPGMTEERLAYRDRLRDFMSQPAIMNVSFSTKIDKIEFPNKPVFMA